MSGDATLARLIQHEHEGWDDPVVCRAVFGATAPEVIAAQIQAWLLDGLGARAVRARFYRVSVGCVAGVDLDDGRAVVVKAQRSGRSATYFESCFAVRRHLANEGFPCPRPLGEPLRRGDVWITFEELVDGGELGDAHDPSTRSALAASLAQLVTLARPLAASVALGRAWYTAIPDDRLWPRPHSPLFDFERTAEGAAWIDDIARRARAARSEPRGELVIGHFDWRVEHLRFEDGRVVASYDWDSLHVELEPVLVGANAHAFTADWQREDLAQAPSVEEILAFLDDYERARGHAFTPDERALARASCVYSLAYTARCGHALRPHDESHAGDFRPLLRRAAEALLPR
ncbi:MAG: phosphotransferase [Myxococcales bacterium]|nr:phosphotransferase [Myxococcales bacterium]